MSKQHTRPLVQHMPLTKARINLGAVIRDVHVNKRYVILEKNGMPVAGIMDIDEFEDYLELQDPVVQRHIAASAKESVAGKGRSASELFAELEAEAKKAKRQTNRR